MFYFAMVSRNILSILRLVASGSLNHIRQEAKCGLKTRHQKFCLFQHIDYARACVFFLSLFSNAVPLQKLYIIEKQLQKDLKIWIDNNVADFFTAMKIQIVVFWVMILCSDVVGYQHFGGPRCIHFQGPKFWYPAISLHGITTQKIAGRKNRSYIFLEKIWRTLQGLPVSELGLRYANPESTNKSLHFFLQEMFWNAVSVPSTKN
jgi:hypothetical protein